MIRELLFALVCALASGSADARPALKATTRALLALTGAETPAWARSAAWKAVIDVWNKLIAFEKATNPMETTAQDIKQLQSSVDAAVAGLQAEGAKGAFGAPTIEVVKAILETQIQHIDRLRASCYEPMPLGYAKREALQARLPLLKKLHAAGKVDTWLYERALKGIENHLRDTGEDGGSYTKEIKKLSEAAMSEALFVQRAFDEYRLAAAADTEAWKALKTDAAPLFGSSGSKAIVAAPDIKGASPGSHQGRSRGTQGRRNSGRSPR